MKFKKIFEKLNIKLDWFYNIGIKRHEHLDIYQREKNNSIST